MMKQDSTVGELMSGRWKWLLIVVVALIAVEQFVTMPDKVMLTSSCQPDGIVNELRAAVLPGQWRTEQLQAIAHELDAPRVQAVAMAAITRIEGLPPPSAADQLRQQAQEIENKELDAFLAPIVAERNSLLRRCFVVTYEERASGPQNK